MHAAGCFVIHCIFEKGVISIDKHSDGGMIVYRMGHNKSNIWRDIFSPIRAMWSWAIVRIVDH